MKKSVTIKTSKQKAWSKVSQIANLSWLEGEENTVFLSKSKTGNGAIRKIKFNDGNFVEEHVVGWKKDVIFHILQ